MTTNDLHANVLVTRPSHQSSILCQLLSAKGLQPICFPTIEIIPATLSPKQLEQLQSCGQVDYVIFISSNAAWQADSLLKHQWLALKTVVAIGPKTAETLTGLTLQPHIVAEKPFNSERLLDCFQNQLRGSNCLIITGEGGRTHLADELQNRGMIVNSIDVYKRDKPSSTANEPPANLQYITVTSQLALENLFAMLPKRTKDLKQNSIFAVFSQRIADFAKALGCQHILVCSEASDQGLVSAIVNSASTADSSF